MKDKRGAGAVAAPPSTAPGGEQGAPRRAGHPPGAPQNPNPRPQYQTTSPGKFCGIFRNYRFLRRGFSDGFRSSA